jgi:hypothetical protein
MVGGLAARRVAARERGRKRIRTRGWRRGGGGLFCKATAGGFFFFKMTAKSEFRLLRGQIF